jgi:hypothetical protein
VKWTWLKELEACVMVGAQRRAQRRAQLSDAGFTADQLSNWDRTQEFALAWQRGGGIAYQLGHSVAAAFAATRPTSVEPNRLPHPAFTILCPTEYVGMPAGGTAGISVWYEEMIYLGLTGPDVAVGWSWSDRWIHEDLIHRGPGIRIQEGGWADEWMFNVRMASRLAANVACYVTEHRESVTVGNRCRTVSMRYVEAPRDLRITKDFRVRVAQMVAARTVATAKIALAHVVRGHWKRQPAGPGRSDRHMIWIHPYRRGDESAGSVVSRIERVL